ncbi:class I SAM-dependent methyltransferase [Magnetospirillum gryphiswaldense]|nr:class I SAM-dependent methyltransferase [Magnetospirillum gryphiswaldense]
MNVRSFSFVEGVIHVCDQCQLQWADRQASAIEGDTDITGAHSRYMDPDSIRADSYEPYVTFFATLRRLLGERPLRILDVGCGNGVFMAEAARRGHDVRGIELDERHRAVIAAELLPKVSFKAAEDALPEMDGSFDVIVFWDSFEHIDAPFALLDFVAPRLAAGGLVFARVNNVWDIFNLLTRLTLSLAPSTLGPRLLKTCFNLPQHAWNFSRIGMRKMLEQRGWRVVHDRVTETPASRLFTQPIKKAILRLAYLANLLIGGGKIGEYYFSRSE